MTPPDPPAKTPPASRRLLARVRDVMAGPGDTGSRLHRIVAIIAADMVAEVCSIYVRRAGDVLELFATQGLRPEAVHRTQLKIGEGIIGDIAAHARPFALSDAQAHPNFAYRPETGEEIYHSLMGVPILRDGRVVGVVAVQNRTQRHYTEEEVETLQTVAMVLAEMIAGGGLGARPGLRDADSLAPKPHRLPGVRLAPGVGMGTAVLHRPRVALQRMVAENPAAEHERLRRAFAEMHGALDDLFSAARLGPSGAHRDVLEAYRMIAEDAGWFGRIEKAIEGGLTAEAAVQKVQNDIRARLSQIDDPYLRERVDDFDDLANRLIQHLVGGDATRQLQALPGDVIVIARALGPAELLDYDPSRLRGVVLEEGSPTAHVALLARALEIPVVGKALEALARIEPGDVIVVDGDNAQVMVRPGEDVQKAFLAAIRTGAERRAGYVERRSEPAVTRDDVRIQVNINAGLLLDMGHLHEFGADGVGLYRTEIPFLVRPAFPDVATQRDLYIRILEQARGKPVVFRTLDVGGDKMATYWDSAEGENPAMGWRAIRVALGRPAILRQQARALIQAAAGGELRVMFPMIATVAEFDAARAIFEREVQREQAAGRPLPRPLLIGAMLEVPSLLFELDALLARADFISIGSNDLLQFLFASDRGAPGLAERYDPLSPLVLGCLADVVRKAALAGRPVGLCGEIAGRPLEAMALIGLGFRDLSLAPPAVGPIKDMIRSLDLSALTAYLGSFAPGGAGRPSQRPGADNAAGALVLGAFAPGGGVALRDALYHFARAHGVVI
ncbi:MAG: phosphoenolpyruvate--protein phosphotransferase [Rhodospirillales bacterium]|nr:phosphoenolpyruvate--protein phosphotransferase [Rhodospirillales bacterium]